MDYPKLEPGSKAPDFELLDQDGRVLKSADLAGKKTVLYFFPAAGSPGCTKEAADFQDHITEFTEAGYQIIGISPDQIEQLKDFQDSHELSFRLLSDPDMRVHKLYGAFGEKTLFGRTYSGVLRSTFLVDKSLKISDAFYNVKATGHTQFLIKRIAN